MYPLLYQVWVAASDEERQSLVEWWAGRHARSMLSVGFLGAHQFESTANGRPPLCNFYEIPGIDVFDEKYHAATLADLKYLDPNGDKYSTTADNDLEDLSSSGSTATIYEQITVFSQPGAGRPDADSITVAVAAPSLSTYKFSGEDRAAVEARFDGTFRGGPPDGCGKYMDVRLARQNELQHPISPLPRETHDWLLVVQWPNRRTGELSHDIVHRVVEQLGDDAHGSVESDLLVNGLSLLSGTGWQM